MKVETQGTKIVFSFDGCDAITFDATKAHPNMAQHAQMHGWEARIRDNAAISRKQKDGTVITVTEAMRRAAVEEMVNHYESGADQWNLRASRAPVQNPVFLDIAARRGCTYAEAEAWYSGNLMAEMQKLIDAENAAKA